MRDFLRKLQEQDEESESIMWQGQNALYRILIRLAAMAASSLAGGYLFAIFNLSYWWILPLGLIGYFAERMLTSITAKRLKASHSLIADVRWWEFLAYLIPRKARQEIYDNLVDEVRIDWIEAKAKSSSHTWLLLIKVAFGVRVAWYFFSTFAAAFSSASLKLVVEAWKNLAG